MGNLVILVLFTIFFVVDIYFNILAGISFSHILHEVALCLIAIGSMLWQIRIIIKKNTHITRLNSELLETKRSYQEWKEKTHSRALEIGQMIDAQFALWHLSHSEKDVALLLIKGLSMKEVADIRNTHEKTVRQQATTIYKKSGLSGRKELAAFFLEDILTLQSDSSPA